MTQVQPWGTVFGEMPAFGSFYAKADAAAHAFHVGSNTRRTPDGWAVKVHWVVQPGTSFAPRLTGHNVTDGTPITFDSANGPRSTTMTLDPQHPGTPSSEAGWTEFPSVLALPEAGCYVVRAEWAGGSWQRGFGFGR